MAYGDIGSVLDTKTIAGASSDFAIYSKATLCMVGTSGMVLIGYADASGNTKISSFSVTNAGIISSIINTITVDTNAFGEVYIAHIKGDIYVVRYIYNRTFAGSAYHGTLRTFSCTSAGVLTLLAGTLALYDANVGEDGRISICVIDASVVSPIIAVCYQHGIGIADTPRIRTVLVAADGSTLTSIELFQVTDLAGYSNYTGLQYLTGTRYLVQIGKNSGNPLYIRQVNIPLTGVGMALLGSFVTLDSAALGMRNWVNVAGNIWLSVCRDKVRTYTFADDGTITLIEQTDLSCGNSTGSTTFLLCTDSSTGRLVMVAHGSNGTLGFNTYTVDVALDGNINVRIDVDNSAGIFVQGSGLLVWNHVRGDVAILLGVDHRPADNYLVLTTNQITSTSGLISTITNLIHRYDRMNRIYNLELVIGGVTSEFGMPEWTTRPVPMIKNEPDPAVTEEVKKQINVNAPTIWGGPSGEIRELTPEDLARPGTYLSDKDKGNKLWQTLTPWKESGGQTIGVYKDFTENVAKKAWQALTPWDDSPKSVKLYNKAEEVFQREFGLSSKQVQKYLNAGLTLDDIRAQFGKEKNP
jgi:hypothetical protein